MTYNPTGGRVSRSERDRAIVGSLVGASLAAGATRMTLGTGIWVARKVRTGASIHRKTVGPVSAVLSTLSTVDSILKIRGGEHRPAFSVKYEPYDPFWVPPIPYIGSIPLIRPRLDIGTRPIEQSRGGEDSMLTSRTGTSDARKTMRGPSAPKRSKKPKFVRYRTGGCPPGYSYDPKRKMCIHNSYR